jgi:glyoxylase-like metal-dependent hydrolase (beta-lactamase superfamily II)
MQEVYPGIFMVTEKGAWGVLKPSINIYIIPGKGGIMYDAGYGSRKSFQHLVSEFQKIKIECASRSQPFEVSRVIVSHAHEDHFSGLYKLRKTLGLSIMLSSLTAYYISTKEKYWEIFNTGVDPNKVRLPAAMIRMLNIPYRLSDCLVKCLAYNVRYLPDPDIIFEGKTEIRINEDVWELFPSPGHSADHITLYNSEKGVLFSGDNVLRAMTTWLGPPNSDLSAYIDSLKYMLTLPRLELILSAHGSVITNPKERIQKLIDWRIKRTRQLYKVIKNSNKKGITFMEIYKQFYQKGGAAAYVINSGWIKVTVDFLIKRRLIIKDDALKIHRYYCVNEKNADEIIF